MRTHAFETANFKESYAIQCAALAPNDGLPGLYPTFCRIPPGGQTKKHAHFEPELFYVIEGSGVITIGSEISEVKAGTLIQIPAYSSHELQNTGSKDLNFLSVYSEDLELPPTPKQVLITSAPPTPNGPLHLGHISGPYLASDILRRWLKLNGACVTSHTGTDDHQNYVAERASKIGQTVELFRQNMRARIAKGLANFSIEVDEFIEPSSNETYQANLVNFTRRAKEFGVIEEELIDFPYCDCCNHYLQDVLVDAICPFCSNSSSGGCESCGMVVPPYKLKQIKCSRCESPASHRSTQVYTFTLGKYLPLILDDLNQLQMQLPVSIRQMVKTVQTNTDLKVLITHPGQERPHVWFEMAAHYEKFAHSSTSWAHCFGFDNAFYYLVFIPALLRGMDPKAKFPELVVTNEFLHLNGLKFSTGRNHAIWADEFTGNHDHLRLYLSLERPGHQASDFVMAHFEMFSQKLSAQLEKLILRQEALAHTHGEADQEFIFKVERFKRDFHAAMNMQRFNTRSAARILMNFLDATLESHHNGASEKLLIHTFVHYLSPFMPNEAEKITRAPGVQQ